MVNLMNLFRLKHSITSFPKLSKKQALNFPRLILLSILAFVSSTPISFNIKAKSELETPRLTNSDFSNRFALSFQFTIIKNFTLATIR